MRKRFELTQTVDPVSSKQRLEAPSRIAVILGWLVQLEIHSEARPTKAENIFYLHCVSDGRKALWQCAVTAIRRHQVG